MAVVGATVTPYVASDIHPNPNSPAAPGVTTDTNGKWVLASLADATVYDVKVEFGTSVKWYKGNTEIAIGHVYDDTSPDPNRNLIPNGGFDLTHFLDQNGAQALPTTDPGNVTNAADGWAAWAGSGDSGTIQKHLTQRPINSKASLSVGYIRSGGQAWVARFVPDGIWQQLRGKTVTLSIQVYQEAASSGLRTFCDDGTGIFGGGATGVIGAWTTISQTFTVSPVATWLRVGVTTLRATTGLVTFYIDNAVLDLGSVAPVFAPEVADAVVEARYTTLDDTLTPALAVSGNVNSLGALLSNLAARIKQISGEASWRAPSGTSLVALFNTKVTKTGDTMSGNLAFSTPFSGVTLAGGTQVRDDVGGGQFQILANANRLVVFKEDASAVILDANGNLNTLTFLGNPVWHAGNDGSLSTLDADTVDGQHAAAFAAVGHTHASVIGVPVNVVALWLEGGAIPVGWVAETRLNGLIPAGAGTTYGAHGTIGGLASHTHAASSLGVGGDVGGPTGAVIHVQVGGVSDPNVPLDNHGHGNSFDVSGSTDGGSSLPPYRAVTYIRQT